MFQEYLREIEQKWHSGRATEHTYRSNLERLLTDFLKSDEWTVINEPTHLGRNSPDMLILKNRQPVGYIEAKNIGANLDRIEETEQLQRYRNGLENLILTDYLEFRLYRQSEKHQSVRLGDISPQRNIQYLQENASDIRDLLNAFIYGYQPLVVISPEDLAARLSQKALLLRYGISRILENDSASKLGELFSAFREHLVERLSASQFADMIAQTMTYGLFAARAEHKTGLFTRESAVKGFLKTSPFLHAIFTRADKGLQKDAALLQEPRFSQKILLDADLNWIVDDLVSFLEELDIHNLLKDAAQGDAIVHFYETFLKAYNPNEKKLRGVYYTPDAVVSYIVRSVHQILQRDFGIPDGLADAETVAQHSGAARTQPRVTILDPATGTGTFLRHVVDKVHDAYITSQSNSPGTWPDYVRKHLLPRLFGFELMVAPYAMCHLSLTQHLARMGYHFTQDERLHVYLTNTLDERDLQLYLAEENPIAKEGDAAIKIKKLYQLMVILGNPPYTVHSANKSDWIYNLLRGSDGSDTATANYFQVDGQPLNERNPKMLNDDYVKFIRFAQWHIERTGYGVLGCITNHGYLDNLTFRGMRDSLLNAFDEIYLLNLHGNLRKKERTPDGEKDENVFDIQQGVAIGFFVKKEGNTQRPCRVFYAALWGNRASKTDWLSENDIHSTQWRELSPVSPNYFLVPKEGTYREEYESGISVKDIFPVNSVSISSGRDELTIHYTREDVLQAVRQFRTLSIDEACQQFGLAEKTVARIQKDLNEPPVLGDTLSPDTTKHTVPICYRPFDTRFTYYTGRSGGFLDRPRRDVMQHFFATSNVGLITARHNPQASRWCHAFVSNKMLAISNHYYFFPLYRYPDGSEAPEPNFAAGFAEKLAQHLDMRFIGCGCGDLRETFGAEDVLHYLYAVLYAPTYQERYAEFLKTDFPRIAFTRQPNLFRRLCEFGKRLVHCHILSSEGTVHKNEPRFEVAGSNVVGQVHYDNSEERAWINQHQYFEGVAPEVWEFQIGAYPPAQSWLKVRKGRILQPVDIRHYQAICQALRETLSVMTEIELEIQQHGGWPL